MRKFVLALLVILWAVGANAGCLKCDQSTGYWCFISIYGTKMYCDTPTNAGCMTWGACNPGAGDCVDPESCVQYPEARTRTRENLQIASVTVRVARPKHRS